MRDLKRIALAELDNDTFYLLALNDVEVSITDMKLATGSEIKQFVLAENMHMFEGNPQFEGEELSEDEMLQLIEESFETDIIPSAYILP